MRINSLGYSIYDYYATTKCNTSIQLDNLKRQEETLRSIYSQNLSEKKSCGLTKDSLIQKQAVLNVKCTQFL